MNTNISWAVEWMKAYPAVNDKTQVVFQVGWRCNAENSGQVSSLIGMAELQTDKLDNFTPYDDLTEQQVLGWVFASIGNKAGIEAQASKNVEEKVQPTVVQPVLPWLAK